MLILTIRHSRLLFSRFHTPDLFWFPPEIRLLVRLLASWFLKLYTTTCVSEVSEDKINVTCEGICLINLFSYLPNTTETLMRKSLTSIGSRRIQTRNFVLIIKNCSDKHEVWQIQDFLLCERSLILSWHKFWLLTQANLEILNSVRLLIWRRVGI